MMDEQEKTGTAIKRAMKIGGKDILDKKTSLLLDTVFKNKRNNQKLGVADFDEV